MNTRTIQILLVVNLFITTWLLYEHYTTASTPDFSDDVLIVRGLAVVDSFGVERAILGAPLPDPTMHGYRKWRGPHSSVAGLMLYDAEGQERGGYVTDDSYGNIFLTLDSKTQQNALFIADANGGAAMQVWGRDGNKISLTAGDEDIYIDISSNGKDMSFDHTLTPLK